MTVIPWKRVWNGCICVSVYAHKALFVSFHVLLRTFFFCHAFSFFVQPRKHDSEGLSTTMSGLKRWNHSAVTQEVTMSSTHCTLWFKVKLLPMIFWSIIINIILITDKSPPVENHKYLEPSWCLRIFSFFQSGCQFSKAEQKKKTKKKKQQSFTFAKLASAFLSH